MGHRMLVEFDEFWEPVQFHGDPKPGDEWRTEEACAAQVADWVRENGVEHLLGDWNIASQLTITVGDTLVVDRGSLVFKSEAA